MTRDGRWLGERRPPDTETSNDFFFDFFKAPHDKKMMLMVSGFVLPSYWANTTNTNGINSTSDINGTSDIIGINDINDTNDTNHTNHTNGVNAIQPSPPSNPPP